MTAGHDHLDDLRELAARRASRRVREPGAVDDPPAGATVTLEAIDLLNGVVRWRDASAAARALAREWGDAPPPGEPPAEPGR